MFKLTLHVPVRPLRLFTPSIQAKLFHRGSIGELDFQRVRPFPVVVCVRLESLDIGLEPIGVVRVVHFLKRLRCMDQRVQPRVFHGQIGLDRFGNEVLIARLIRGVRSCFGRLSKRKESPVGIGTVDWVVWGFFEASPYSVTTLHPHAR